MLGDLLHDVMPKGNEFNKSGVQPSLNAFFFSLTDSKPRDVVLDTSVLYKISY